jgi:hypothetical protein
VSEVKGYSTLTLCYPIIPMGEMAMKGEEPPENRGESRCGCRTPPDYHDGRGLGPQRLEFDNMVLISRGAIYIQ